MKKDTLFDERFADLLLQARGIEAVRGILAGAAPPPKSSTRTRALESVRHQLAERLAV